MNIREQSKKEKEFLDNHPINNVLWIDKDRVQANDYNPNSVAKVELKLLHTSISHDGYTQPIVTVYDEDKDKYIIVDGFHRHLIASTYDDIAESTGGKVPIVVLKKQINDRMASTVRHNRARGKHSVKGMSSMVFTMLSNGMSDEDICNELGMDAQEIVRLKHITGFSKLFKDTPYNKAWETDRQIKIRKYYKDNGEEETKKHFKQINSKRTDRES